MVVGVGSDGSWGLEWGRWEVGVRVGEMGGGG